MGAEGWTGADQLTRLDIEGLEPSTRQRTYRELAASPSIHERSRTWHSSPKSLPTSIGGFATSIALSSRPRNRWSGRVGPRIAAALSELEHERIKLEFRREDLTETAWLR